LVHDAQEIAILTGKEVLNLETLNEAYQKRLSLLHEYIQPTIIHKKRTSKTKKQNTINNHVTKNHVNSQNKISFKDLVSQSKDNQLDIVILLKKYITVVEVPV
jgi:hypothetical protein